jgi:hypothetical protein
MKQEIISNGKKQILDTDRDPRLYIAPRGREKDSLAWQHGKDIYYHKEGRGQGIYYLHLWTLVPNEVESVMILPDRQAERFLGERGLECSDIPGIKAYTTLKHWGYGILEEF